MPTCPTCGAQLTYVERYDRYYCPGERKYAPKGLPVEPRATVFFDGTERHAGHYHCPICGKELTYIPPYDRHYCYACAKYAPKGIQPVAGTPPRGGRQDNDPEPFIGGIRIRPRGDLCPPARPVGRT